MNGRPVTLTKATKAVNDSWRRHDLNHKPGFILDLLLPRGSLDVNVTPDKREVFIIQENRILEMLKERLEELWKPSEFKYQVKPIDQYYSSSAAQSKSPEPVSQPPEERSQSSLTDPFASSPESAQRDAKPEATQVLDRTSSSPPAQPKSSPNSPEAKPAEPPKENQPVVPLPVNEAEATSSSATSKDSPGCCSGPCIHTKRKADTFGLRKKKIRRLKAAKSVEVELSDLESSVSTELVASSSKGSLSKKKRPLRESAKGPPKVLGFGGLTSVEAAFNARMDKEAKVSSSDTGCTQMDGVKELGVDNTDHNTVAEQLEKVFRKEDFLSAQVLGQFNLGFIIARVHHELFILDQHACDEIYNFERLQEKTKVHEQRLIKPLPLDLSAAEHQIVQDNLSVFEANGFQFKEEIVEGTAQLCLTAVPQPDNFKTQFGADDVKELASVLRNNPRANMEKSRIPLLPKTRAMYASKACRSSIMIGDALQKNQMTTVVQHLAKLDRPWNCPHGRPTMRHLVDLVQLYTSKAASNEAWRSWQNRIPTLMKSSPYFLS